MDLKTLGSIAIQCRSIPCHDWMSFASWYSIRKWLPDCEVYIETVLDQPLFGWAGRVGVRVLRKIKADIKIQPTVMMLREYLGSNEIASSKSNTQNSFIDYSDGCGNFVVSEWIDTQRIPFQRALRRFGNQNLTVNEIAILNFWDRCAPVYRSVGGT